MYGSSDSSVFWFLFESSENIQIFRIELWITILQEKLIVTSESWILLGFKRLVKWKDRAASGKRISFRARIDQVHNQHLNRWW